MNLETLDYHYAALAAGQCACGKKKTAGIPVCQACAEALPRYLLRNMIQSLADYGEAYRLACIWMGTEKPRWTRPDIL